MQAPGREDLGVLAHHKLADQRVVLPRLPGLRGASPVILLLLIPLLVLLLLLLHLVLVLMVVVVVVVVVSLQVHCQAW